MLNKVFNLAFSLNSNNKDYNKLSLYLEYLYLNFIVCYYRMYLLIYIESYKLILYYNIIVKKVKY